MVPPKKFCNEAMFVYSRAKKYDLDHKDEKIYPDAAYCPIK